MEVALSANFTSFWKRYVLSQGIEEADADRLADANIGDHGAYAVAFGDIVCMLTEQAEDAGAVIKATAFLKTVSEDELSHAKLEQLSSITDCLAAPVLVMEETSTHLALVAQRPLHSLREESFVDWMHSLESCCQACAGGQVLPQPMLAPAVGMTPLLALWEQCGVPLDAGSDDFWLLTFPDFTVILEYDARIGRACFRTLAGDGTAGAPPLRHLLSCNLSWGAEPYFSFLQGHVWLNTPFFVEGESPQSLLAILEKHMNACRGAVALFASATKEEHAPEAAQQWVRV